MTRFLVAEAEAARADEAAARAVIAARADAAGLDVADYLGRRARVRRAKNRAAVVGLTYWPALLTRRHVDPRAFAAAERVLARKHGLWQPAVHASQHGGWDMYGCYGRSPEQVVAFWRAAGCCDSPKFRWLVATGVQAKKGDSLPWLRHFARGDAWLKRWSRRYATLQRVSRKAVAALGRLSAVLRHVALEGLAVGLGEDSPLRIRDLNWAAVSAAQAQLRSGSPRVRAAYTLLFDEAGDPVAGPYRAAAGLLGASALQGHEVPQCECARCQVSVYKSAFVDALAPAYARIGRQISLQVARRIALGDRPVDIAGPTFCAREAHEWLLAGAPPQAEWLCAQLGRGVLHRSVRVVRWLMHLDATRRWDGLTRTRSQRVPGRDDPHEWTALDVLDEIQEEDIVTGKDRVDDVLERSARRLGDAWLEAHAKDHRPLCGVPTWWPRCKWIRLLRTAADLVTEGRELNHCVASYVPAVERGQCLILALHTPDGARSTVELSLAGVVRQHYARGNTSPCARHRWLLTAWLRRLRRDDLQGA